MKTIKYVIIVFILFSLTENLKSQNFGPCGVIVDTANIYKAFTTCGNSSAAYIDKYRTPGYWIPDENTPIKTILVNWIICRNDAGGNGWQNTTAFRNQVALMFSNINDWYSNVQPKGYSLTCEPSIDNISDTRIRFELNDIIFIDNSAFNLSYNGESILNYVHNNYPSSKDVLNHIFTQPPTPTSGDSWGYYTVTSGGYSYVHTKYSMWSPDIVVWDDHINHITHEYGHAVGLHHTYDSERLNISHFDFLDDVFGLCNEPICGTPPAGNVSYLTYNCFWQYQTTPFYLMSGRNNSRYISPKAAGRMHRALSLYQNTYLVNNMPMCDYVKEKYPYSRSLTIADDEIWDFAVKMYQNIVIDSGVTLTIKCEVRMPIDGKIIVKPGAKLIVDGGKITCAHQNLWQGIEVWGHSNQHQYTLSGICHQGTCILTNGAIIENAREGITNWKSQDYNSIGGIIQATNTNFINNWRAVSFMAYYNFNPSNPSQIVNDRSGFYNCSFKTTSDLLNGDPFYAFISMWKVKGVKVEGCLFENSNPNATSLDLLGSGIISIDADFSVIEYCQNSQATPCPEADLFKTNFMRLKYGINAQKSETNNTYDIKNSIFTNCFVGIYNTGVNSSVITGNSFLYNSLYSPITQGTGICFNTGTGYTIEENSFSSSTTSITTIGAYMQNGGANANQIYRNTLSSFTYGLCSVAQNRSSDGTVGLQFLCNNFSSCIYDMYIKNGASINGMRRNQGEYISSTNIIGAGNKFTSGATYNIRNSSGYSINYYYGTGTNEYPTSVTSLVNRVAATINNTCPCNIGGGSNRSVETISDMFSGYYYNKELELMYKTLLYSLIDGGNSNDLVNQIELSWPSETWQLRQLLLSKSPYLSEEVLKQSSQIGYVLPNPILFEIFSSNPEGYYNDELLNDLSEKAYPMSDWMVDSLRSVRCRFTYRSTIEGNIAEYAKLKEIDGFKIIRNSVRDTNDMDHNKLNSLLSDFNSFNTEIMAINDYCQRGDYVTAETILQDMQTKFDFTQTEQEEYDWFVQLFAQLKLFHNSSRTIFQIDSLELMQIKLIADEGYGLGKNYAQNICGIYGYIYDPVFDLEDEIPVTKNVIVHNPIASESDKLIALSVYPSLAKEWVSIKWNLMIESTNSCINVVNQEGKTLFSYQIESSLGEKTINIQNWPEGTYVINLISTGKIIKSVKIVKI